MSKRESKPAAIGLRTHSGWAALVVAAGTPRSPEIIERQRIELTDSGLPRQPYHAAQKLELAQAEQLIQRCTDCANALAYRAFEAVIAAVKKKGYTVVGCGLLRGSGRPLTTLEAILSSHAMIHTAEGELFRETLVRAGKSLSLPVTGVKERELLEVASSRFRLEEVELRRRLTELGRSLGPPWTQDQKSAALVGWLALASAATRK